MIPTKYNSPYPSFFSLCFTAYNHYERNAFWIPKGKLYLGPHSHIDSHMSY